MDLTALNKQIKQCNLCDGLNQEATSTSEATLNAPGYGNSKTKVVIIGQSLCGEPCIKSQIPFTGGCGTLLNKAFEQSGVTKDQLYITNVVKCHPPGNRKSEPLEKKNCSQYLKRELEILTPTAIICLGSDAKDFFDTKAKLDTEKEILLNNNKVVLYFMYHPSYIQRWRKAQKQSYIDFISDIITKNQRA